MEIDGSIPDGGPKPSVKWRTFTVLMIVFVVATMSTIRVVYAIHSLNLVDYLKDTDFPSLKVAFAELKPASDEAVFQRFSELPIGTIPSKFNDDSVLYSTAFRDASHVIINATSFFQPRRICESTCCVESVAISLDQDDHHIINTLDGLDMADVRLQQYPSADYIQFFGSLLDPDVLPCFQPGTIIHVDTHVDLLEYFFYELRPKINTSFVFITSESDAHSPLAFADKLSVDKSLIRWFGTNPSVSRLNDNQKEAFEAMPLGLAKFHEQDRLLTRYLAFNNYTNPFRNKDRWTLSTIMSSLPSDSATKEDLQLPTDSDDQIFYDSIFVRFGLHKYAPRIRTVMFEQLCNQTTLQSVNLKDNITCTLNSAPTSEQYAAASRYLFGFSPPGVGADCYRTYELLLLGVIPIIQDTHGGWAGLFDDLPVVILPDLGRKHTSSEVLQLLRNYITSPQFQDADFEKGWKKLFLRHWRRRVLEAARRDIIVDPASGDEFYVAWRYTSTTSSPPAGLGVPQWYKDKGKHA